MARDIYVQDIPAEALSVGDIPDDWEPAPLPYSHSVVVAAVGELVPDADLSNPEWIVVNLGTALVEVSGSDESPFEGFALHVRGDNGTANVFVSRLLERLGSKAFDIDSETGIFTS